MGVCHSDRPKKKDNDKRKIGKSISALKDSLKLMLVNSFEKHIRNSFVKKYKNRNFTNLINFLKENILKKHSFSLDLRRIKVRDEEFVLNFSKHLFQLKSFQLVRLKTTLTNGVMKRAYVETFLFAVKFSTNITQLSLNLSSNGLGDVELIKIGSALSELKNLTRLKIVFLNNSITRSGIKGFHKHINTLKQLKLKTFQFFHQTPANKFIEEELSTHKEEETKDQLLTN